MEIKYATKNRTEPTKNEYPFITKGFNARMSASIRISNVNSIRYFFSLTLKKKAENDVLISHAKSIN